MAKSKRETTPEKAEGSPAPDETRVSVGAWRDQTRVVRRAFPGPRGASTRLRVAMEQPVYSSLLVHAKESLDKEVCGVLAGEVCEDDDGLFIAVRGAIRGGRAKEGATHVTFTQETWEAIHAEMEETHPKLAIIGWYHTHPGFGVEFSEMDLFIQRSFFSAPTQIALVMDPLSGEEAICTAASDGEVQYLERFWIGGRERRCQVPARMAGASEVADASHRRSTEDLEQVEVRLSQVIQAMDELRTSVNRSLTTLFALACVMIVFLVGYNLYRALMDTYEPPRLRQYVSVPIKVGDEQVFIGLGVVDWIIPEKLQIKQETAKPEEAKADVKSEATQETEPGAKAH